MVHLKTQSFRFFWGLKGNGRIMKNSQIFYNVIYRNTGPDEYEVLLINIRPGTSINYLSKLKEGKLDNKIKKLLDS